MYEYVNYIFVKTIREYRWVLFYYKILLLLFMLWFFIIGMSEWIFNYKTEDQIFGKHTFVYISMQANFFPSYCNLSLLWIKWCFEIAIADNF